MTNHTPQAVSSVASDWPGSGPIDLEIHDRPHRSSTTEWWYLNTHLTAANGRSYSVFAAFFALAIDQDPVTRANKYAYSIEWALVDVETQRYVYDSVLDRSATDVGMRRIDKGEGVRDKLFGRALRETFAKGKVPLPDRMFEREPRVAWDRLARLRRQHASQTRRRSLRNGARATRRADRLLAGVHTHEAGRSTWR